MQRPFLGFWPERKRMEKRRVEILAPAGSYESMVAAVNAGANAVYIGGSRFGARAYADNLDEEAMIRAIDFVHLHNCRIYMTVNTLVKEKELPELYGYLKPYYEAGLDAVLVQDLGVFSYIREYFPDLPLHISTQMTVTGKYSAAELKRMGAVRVRPQGWRWRPLSTGRSATAIRASACFPASSGDGAATGAGAPRPAVCPLTWRREIRSLEGKMKSMC